MLRIGTSQQVESLYSWRKSSLLLYQISLPDSFEYLCYLRNNSYKLIRQVAFLSIWSGTHCLQIFRNSRWSSIMLTKIRIFPFMIFWFFRTNSIIFFTKPNGSMSLSKVSRRELPCTSLFPSILFHVYTCQGYTVFAIHSRCINMIFACFSILSHQETNFVLLCLPIFPMFDEHFSRFLFLKQ